MKENKEIEENEVNEENEVGEREGRKKVKVLRNLNKLDDDEIEVLDQLADEDWLNNPDDVTSKVLEARITLAQERRRRAASKDWL